MLQYIARKSIVYIEPTVFNSMDELYTHLKAREEKEKQQGVKYVSFFDPSKHTPPEESTDESRKTS